MVISVIGPAMAGKSTFSAISKIYGYKVYDISIGLKALEEYCYQFYKSGMTQGPDDSLRLACDFYNKTMGWVDKIAIEMANWYRTNALQIHNNKRRNALQYLGTELMRYKFGHYIHIDGLVNLLKKDNNENVVIESLRFESEISELKKAFPDTKFIIVRRKDMMDGDLSTHVSEQEWKKWADENKNGYFEINNSGTLHQYITACSKYLSSV